MNNSTALQPTPLPRVVAIEKLLQYNIVTQPFTQDMQIPLQNYCNGFTVKNTGNTWLVFQGEVLTAGQSKAIGGNRGEIYGGRLEIKFKPAVPVVVPAVNEATITQKFYTNIDQQ